MIQNNLCLSKFFSTIKILFLEGGPGGGVNTVGISNMKAPAWISFTVPIGTDSEMHVTAVLYIVDASGCMSCA